MRQPTKTTCMTQDDFADHRDIDRIYGPCYYYECPTSVWPTLERQLASAEAIALLQELERLDADGGRDLFN